MSWTHAVCDDCYAEMYPDRSLVRLIDDSMDCCWCGKPTQGGYLRFDPTTVACQGSHTWD